MKLIFSFCIIGALLGVSVRGEGSCGGSDPDQDDFDVAAKSLEEAKKVLDLYDKTLDTVIDWKVFNETAEALEKGRGRYSQESGELVGAIVTAMLNSENHYFTATQSISNWCGESISYIDGYILLFQSHNKVNAEGQKELILRVLDLGLEKMDIALDHINQSIVNFDIATGKLVTLDNQLELDFKEGSKKLQEEIDNIRTNQWIAFLIPPVGIGMTIYNEVKSIPDLKRSIEDLVNFFRGLQGIVTKTVEAIKKARDELKRETIIIDNLKCQTSVTRTFVGLKSQSKVLIEMHGNNLIRQCRAYRRRHGQV